MTTLKASQPELAVYGALKKTGLDFQFQSRFFGGTQVRGGLVADFYLPSLSLVINVQSFYWHYGNPQRIAQDRIQQIALEGQGIRVIYIDEQDALKDATRFVQDALRGIDHSRMTK